MDMYLEEIQTGMEARITLKKIHIATNETSIPFPSAQRLNLAN
jgi:hypothetical protein